MIWTGGIRGNHMLEDAGFETMRGRIKVDETLRIPGHENVYVLGDCSLVFNPEGRPYPPTAQISMQQADVCAHNLVAQIRNSTLKAFEYKPKGTVASLGRGEAIGIVGSKKIKGGTAAIMKKIIDLRYLYIIGGIPLVLKKGKF
ncbi:NADH dehydrogenase-like protein [compost metagenome]